MSDRTILGGPADVVAAIPSLIGFHPVESLVLLWTSQSDGSLLCTLRLDLDVTNVQVQRHVFDLAAHTGAGRALLVAYPTSLATWIDSPTEDRMLDLAQELRDADVPVLDLLVVCEGRCWSSLCTDPDCCPIGGTPIPEAVTDLEVRLVHAGQVSVATTRDEVVARYELHPKNQPPGAVMEAARDSVPAALAEGCDRALELVSRLTDSTPSQATDSARAELLWLLQDVNVRDWTLAHLCTAEPDLPGVEVLVQLALAAPDQLRPRVAGAAAAALYATGGTSIGATALIEHAEGDSLAGLVGSALDACLPPRSLQEAFATALPMIEDRIRDDIPA